MPEKWTSKIPFAKERAQFAAALAEKGGPGILMLGFMFVIFWSLPIGFGILYFYYLPDSFTQAYGNHSFNIAYLFAGLIALVVLSLLIFELTKDTFRSIIPTLKADAAVASLMSGAFGGRVITASGEVTFSKIDKDVAKTRMYRIMDALVKRAAQVLEVKCLTDVRANICVTTDNRWLSLIENLHVNMENEKERTIHILSGYLSSGTSFKYVVPVISLAREEGGDIHWDHEPDPDTFKKQLLSDDLFDEQQKELKKADDKLSWILSMPIPYQVNPFRMACGVLNLDGFSTRLYRDQVKSLLADAAVAAALIGIINKSVDVLAGQCSRPEEIPKDVAGIKGGSLKSEFLIDSKEFNPADCPEPSEEFKEQLSNIKGLEFFHKVSTTDVALFIRKQL